MNRSHLAIFDLDGTLFDTKDVNFYAYSEALSAYNRTIDYEYFCKHCNGRDFHSFLPHILDQNVAAVHDVHARKKEAYKKYLDKARPNQNLLNIARLIRPEYYTAVVTTASKVNCMQLLQHFGAIGLFDVIFTQEDVKRKKPDPEGFHTAQEFFSVPIERTIVFEDSATGIQAAQAFGCDYYVVKMK